MTEFSFVLACKVEKVVEFDFSSLDGIASEPFSDWIRGLIEVLDPLPKL